MNAQTIIAIGLVTFAITKVMGMVFASNATAVVVLQALAAEIGSGRAGVRWSSTPSASRPSSAVAPRRRAFEGAAAGLILAAVLLAVGAASSALRLSFASSPSIVTLLLGAVVATAGAVRDELLLRGVIVTAFAGRLPRHLVLLGAGAAGVAAVPLSSASEIIARFAIGIVLAAVWLLDRGAVRAVALAAGLAFGTGPLVAGGLLDASTSGKLLTSTTGILGSPAAAALFTLLALGAVTRKPARLFANVTSAS